MLMYKTIIIEDDPMVSSINKQYLSSSKELTLVESFTNGKDALAYCRTNPVDLAIVDYYMPVMDGLEFIRCCRGEELALDCIMITAANRTEDITTIMRLGAVDYLVKPFTYDRFQTAISRFLEKKRLLTKEDALSQEEIDRLISPMNLSLSQNAALPEKGLQQKTLDRVCEFFRSHKDSFFTSDEIAKEIGLSRITIRRYVNYLMDTGLLVSEIDYGTGGRPSIRYKIKV
ncbi:MAG: response regulator [Lachnospiraceae bacterium]|nr:response regulator [Lachnospiraceae bacterium]